MEIKTNEPRGGAGRHGGPRAGGHGMGVERLELGERLKGWEVRVPWVTGSGMGSGNECQCGRV